MVADEPNRDTRVARGQRFSSSRLFGALRWLLLAISALAAHAAEPLHLQQLQHRTWTVSDNAPSHIYDIAQGTDGKLWLSTTFGIYSYNGATFAAFQPPPGSQLHYAYALTMARNGTLWGSSYLQGVISIANGRLTTYGPEQGLPRGGMDTLAEAPDGTMWAAGGGALYHLHDGRWTAEGAASGLPAGEVLKVIFDRRGVAWVVTKRSLYFREPDHPRFEPTSESWDASSFVCTLIESPSGELWIALDQINSEKSTIKQLDVKGHPASHPQSFVFPFEVQDAKFDRVGSLWVSGHGLDRITFNPQAGGAAQRESLDPSQGFSSSETRSLLPDADGDLWVTTLRGLERFKEPRLIKLSDRVVDSSTRPDIAAGSNGRVWIGTGSAPLLRADANGTMDVGPAFDSFFCLFEDRDGAVWFNSRKGLWREQAGKAALVPVPPGVFFQDLRQVVQLADGTLLFAFRAKGIWRWAAGQWTPLHLSEQPGVMYVDSRGTLWGGFLSGRISTLGGHLPQSFDGADLGAIYAFLQVPQGLLVSGERRVALVRDNQLIPLRFAEGLQATGISGMVQSLDGDLWLNGEHGVVHVYARELETFLKSPQSPPLNAELVAEPDLRGPAPFLYDIPTAARDGAGRLWFVTSDMIAYIDPSRRRTVPALPNLALTSVEADGKALDAGKLRAPAGSHTLRIAYFGTYLSAPEKVRYRYKLDGVDDGWQDVGQRTEAVYTRLRPGHYWFHVEASSGAGGWTSPVSTQFVVAPTFYQTDWFYALCAAVALGLAALVYRLRVRYLLGRTRERADERLNERLRIARDLHDTLLQGVHGLMLTFHVAAQGVPAESNVRKALDGALRQADRVMVEGRDRLSQLRSESLGELTLPQALKSMAATIDTQSPSHIQVRVLSPEVPLYPPVADEVFVIAREALTNACRHAEASSIGVDLYYAPKAFTMVCHDDGRGFSIGDAGRTSQGGHYGLLGMRERAHKIGATFEVSSEGGGGTRIRLTLPARLAYVSRSRWGALLRSYRWPLRDRAV